MQTKKHFIAMAALLSKIPNLVERKALAESQAGIFMRDNPRFNRPRFMVACGLPPAVEGTFPAVRVICGG